MKQNLDLGQHFMIDKSVLKNIIKTASLSSQDKVLEIGPGKGALTKLLEQTPIKKLICVEQDSRFEVQGEKIEFIQGNILNVIDGLTFTTVVANIPYHISEPLFQAFLRKQPKKIVVVVGIQFAKKLLEETILGTIIRELYTVKLIQEIPREAFDPAPRTKSALLHLESKKLSLMGELLISFYTSSKNKVKNYLSVGTKNKYTKKEFKILLEELPQSILEKYNYELSTEEFLQLIHFLQKTFLNK